MIDWSEERGGRNTNCETLGDEIEREAGIAKETDRFFVKADNYVVEKA